ncbi:6,7-dimethyl-8-ribityllumazine synthase [Rickettsiales bacterium LUAb2]
MKVVIIKAKWNNDITNLLFEDCKQTLEKNNIEVLHFEVAGAVELATTAKKAILILKPKAVICIGCVIKGETDHDIFVSQQAAYGCQKVSIETVTPVIFGVLTTQNKQLAMARANGEHSFSGKEWAETAIMSMKLFHQLENTKF